MPVLIATFHIKMNFKRKEMTLSEWSQNSNSSNDTTDWEENILEAENRWGYYYTLKRETAGIKGKEQKIKLKCLIIYGSYFSKTLALYVSTQIDYFVNNGYKLSNNVYGDDADDLHNARVTKESQCHSWFCTLFVCKVQK